MESEDWTTSPSVIDLLKAEPWRFSFYQAVYLLEQAHSSAISVGGAGPPEGEVLRFRPDTSLASPESPLLCLKDKSNSTRTQPLFELTTTFFGLYGASSPLPLFYAEDILWRDRDEDPDPVREFLDIFHHRLHSLLYRAWVKYRYHVQYDDQNIDDFSWRLLGLLGLATPHLLNEELKIPPRQLLRYAGLLTQQTRSASGLEGILCDFFYPIPMTVEQCTGRWVEINQEQRSLLGEQNCSLGVDSILGTEVYSRNCSFGVVVGPISYQDYLQFVPGHEGARKLQELVRLYLHDYLFVKLECHLIEKGLPMVELFDDEEFCDKSVRFAGQLGLTTWLGTDEFETVKIVQLGDLLPS